MGGWLKILPEQKGKAGQQAGSPLPGPCVLGCDCKSLNLPPPTFKSVAWDKESLPCGEEGER